MNVNPESFTSIVNFCMSRIHQNAADMIADGQQLSVNPASMQGPLEQAIVNRPEGVSMMKEADEWTESAMVRML